LTRLLVSVANDVEAVMAAEQGAHLIDAKDPSRGALGALPLAAIEAIRRAVPHPIETSAVAGDDEDIARLVSSALEIARTGMSFVKLGLGKSLAQTGPIGSLGNRLKGQGRFVAVLFADEEPRPSLVSDLRHAGFIGAMLDTRNKRAGRLRDILAPSQLSGFVNACRDEGMMCGLAGSLRIDDIPALAVLGPDYLGFRGGLCVSRDRSGALDPNAVRQAADALADFVGGERAA